MKISRIKIRNYRNIANVDIILNGTTAFIGENNCGKSNILRAISLPLFSEDSTISKSLSWEDINNTAKKQYYKFLSDNLDRILEDKVSEDEFVSVLPVVTVELLFSPEDNELYYVKDLAFDVSDNQILYGILYQYQVAKPKVLLQTIKSILSKEGTTIDIDNIKRNLLPIQLYSYSITVPDKGEKISYDTFKHFKYSVLQAERDNFSYESNRVGSRSLVKLLQMQFSEEDQLKIEKGYENFFETLKNLSGMDAIINLKDRNGIPNASDFIKGITVLPNMPPISSILNSVRLGYAGENLSSQGLGHRNLILLLVILNSLRDINPETAINVLIVEEPEAHLCINNVRLMCSFINILTKNDPRIQFLYSTHSSEFVNKHNMNSVVILDEGNAFALGTELNDCERSYLSKNPNTDIFKLFFSHRCILVEGLSEELLIKGYIESKSELNDIDVISFHKGFEKIIDIWLKVNSKKRKKLGIIRDFDNQRNAQTKHEVYNNFPVICVQTTQAYTLEPEIVKTGNNYMLLREKYGNTYGWNNLNVEQLAMDWERRKSDVMLRISKDLASGELDSFTMPQHIQRVIEFLQDGVGSDDN